VTDAAARALFVSLLVLGAAGDARLAALLTLVLAGGLGSRPAQDVHAAAATAAKTQTRTLPATFMKNSLVHDQ
jgi:hypothetical protein